MNLLKHIEHGWLHNMSAAPVGRQLWFLDLWMYLNLIDLQTKIAIVETNLLIEQKKKHNRHIQPPWRASVANIALTVVLCPSMTLCDFFK